LPPPRRDGPATGAYEHFTLGDYLHPRHRTRVAWRHLRGLGDEGVAFVLAHEWGHAFLHALEEPEARDEAAVDQLAQDWGFTPPETRREWAALEQRTADVRV